MTFSKTGLLAVCCWRACRRMFQHAILVDEHATRPPSLARRPVTTGTLPPPAAPSVAPTDPPVSGVPGASTDVASCGARSARPAHPT